MPRAKRTRPAEDVAEAAGTLPAIAGGSAPAAVPTPPWIEGPGSDNEGRLAWVAITPMLKALAAFEGLPSMVLAVGRGPRPPEDAANGRLAQVWDGVQALLSLGTAIRPPPIPRPTSVNYLIPLLEDISTGVATDPYR